MWCLQTAALTPTRQRQQVEASQEVMSRKYLLLFYITYKVGTRLGRTLLDQLSSCWDMLITSWGQLCTQHVGIWWNLSEHLEERWKGAFHLYGASKQQMDVKMKLHVHLTTFRVVQGRLKLKSTHCLYRFTAWRPSEWDWTNVRVRQRLKQSRTDPFPCHQVKVCLVLNFECCLTFIPTLQNTKCSSRLLACKLRSRDDRSSFGVNLVPVNKSYIDKALMWGWTSTTSWLLFVRWSLAVCCLTGWLHPRCKSIAEAIGTWGRGQWGHGCNPGGGLYNWAALLW